jgi:hypothetical protein
MNRRPHGRKPAIALWMLVAVADLGLLGAAGGLLTLVLIGAALASGAAFVLLRRRGAWPAFRFQPVRPTAIRTAPSGSMTAFKPATRSGVR